MKVLLLASTLALGSTGGALGAYEGDPRWRGPKKLVCDGLERPKQEVTTIREHVFGKSGDAYIFATMLAGADSIAYFELEMADKRGLAQGIVIKVDIHQDWKRSEFPVTCRVKSWHPRTGR